MNIIIENFISIRIDYKDFKNKVGGFCNEMKDGLWYDDDDLLYRINKVFKIKSVNENLYGIHQWHKSSSHSLHNEKTKTLIEKIKIFTFQIKKIIKFIVTQIKNKDNMIEFIIENI